MIMKYSNPPKISFKSSWLYNSSFHKQSKAPSIGQLVFYFPDIARHSTLVSSFTTT